MILSGVKEITIPEGTVKKIQCGGKMLWEKPDVLHFSPGITVSGRKGVYDPQMGTGRIEATILVSGIPVSAVQTVSAFVQKYNSYIGWVDLYSTSAFEMTTVDENTYEYVALFGSSSMLQGGERVYGSVTYIDSDGSTQTISSYASLA